MADSVTGQMLSGLVREAVASAAGYLALVTRVNPRGSADQLLKRPDTDAVLQEALDEARQAAQDAVRAHWEESGAGDSDETLADLLTDARRLFGDIAHLRGLVRHAHASVPQRMFTPGRDAPGTNPSQRAAEERAEAVQAALLDWGRQAALRARMTAALAEGAGTTAAVLARAERRLAAGERVMKRWRAHTDQLGCCIWCRRLDGVTIPVSESFEPYLGGPVKLPQARPRRVRTPEGERRYRMPAGSRIVYTHPPKPYRGRLQGPLLHPFCRCWLEIVRVNGLVVPSETDDGDGALPASFLSADDVRDMPEQEYEADRVFIQAASYELDQVLKRLAGGGG